MTFIEYLSKNYSEILDLALKHIQLTFFSVIIAIIIGLPIGFLISHYKKSSKPILIIGNIIKTIPGMAILGIMIPLFGIGEKPAIIMVMLYSLFPIIKNTSLGLQNISPKMFKTAKGMSMSSVQIFLKLQLPIAIPAIIKGIKIAAVRAVSLMTLSAYIGAEGLGLLIFSGIHTMDTNMILAGGISSSLLAFIINIFFVQIENSITPLNLKKEKFYTDENRAQKRKKHKIILARIGVTLIVLLYITASFLRIRFSTKTIVLSSKPYTEQILLANITAQLIEAHTGIKVEKRLGIGRTDDCLDALKTGDVDLQIEYTGTMYSGVLNQPAENITCDEIYNISKKMYKKKYNIEVLDSWGFNNTYALAVRHKTAKRFNLKTISDLAKIAPKLKLASNFDFINREDGLLGLNRTYDMQFRKTVPIDGKPRYKYIKDDECDVIVVFTTDALAKQYNLVILEDDKKFFLPYNPVPIIRTEILNEYPEIGVVLSMLADNLTDKQMRELNYRIEVKGEKSEQVAKSFLKANGYID